MTHTVRISLVLVTASAAGAFGPVDRAFAGVPDDGRPPVVVALGDSAASGEGAGGYEPGTRGEGGNWCHRSPAAYVHHTTLADRGVNLACSGAGTAHVAFGTAVHHTEGSQATRLGELARRNRVVAVTLQIGANDEPDLAGTAVACIRAYLDLREPGCRYSLGPRWADRLAAVTPRVEGAVQAVRGAMTGAGYRDGDYALVLLSYSAPGSEAMPIWHAVQGCPFSRPDAAWSRTEAFPRLSEAIERVAERTGARFLDLTRLAEGREACTRDVGEEWQRRVTVDPRALVQGTLGAAGMRLFQESFHPTAAAHAAIAGCLSEFVPSGVPRAACVPARDGRAHPEVTV
ncbi:GDSL-type esterase/lipase family protein [Pseudonocardia pini]|uniref:GDSL-type esterase/lipase family protein n=1 Tax=Pseudonocardia pini TaxID=2758030 RepID=UPI0028B00057|nr:GDSL-type esterase/lipase family protein [Pseudonocardia pini]